MMTPQEALKQMRELGPTQEYGETEVEEWADAIEFAMREPVAVSPEFTVLEWIPTADMPPPGTKLFTLPPDAAGEIEFLNNRLKEAEVELEFYRKAALAGAGSLSKPAPGWDERPVEDKGASGYEFGVGGPEMKEGRTIARKEDK